MPAETASARRRNCAGSPRQLTVPLVGDSAPAMILISVDLPAPLPPTSPLTSPGRTPIDPPLRTGGPPGVNFETARSSSSGLCASSSTAAVHHCGTHWSTFLDVIAGVLYVRTWCGAGALPGTWA